MNRLTPTIFRSFRRRKQSVAILPFRHYHYAIHFLFVKPHLPLFFEHLFIFFRLYRQNLDNSMPHLIKAIEIFFIPFTPSYFFYMRSRFLKNARLLQIKAKKQKTIYCFFRQSVL